jgi:carboxyl-terminal processing protease
MSGRGLRFHKGKLLVFATSFLIALYGLSAAFYGKVVAKDEAYKELSVFMEVLHKVTDDYVEAPNMTSVQEGAMRGLIDALDPYCSFLSKDQFDALQKRKATGNAGLGIVLAKRSDVIYVVSVERDGAAGVSGIRPGDYLLAVNGKDVENQSILEVDSFFHGAAGTKVKLTLFRSSRTTKPLEIDMALKDPSPSPIDSKMLEGNTGLLDIGSLGNSNVEQIKLKLKTLVSAGAKKLILDLRDCADGTPKDGSDLANFFLRTGTIYYSQNRQNEKVQVVEASAERFITDLPMVVLIDGSTAGAAEITAGALKDSGRATIVGEKSFGVGSAQKTIQLKSGAVLILSTAKFCTPNGKVIQDEALTKAGITPDVQAPEDEKRQDLIVESYYDDQEEAAKYKQLQEKIEKIQLDKALEILAKEKVPVKKLG